MCKSMNRAEFKAILAIAKKLGWKSVNFETISQMVRNQQALELDTVGECDGFEETLLSIALWDRDKIVSTMYVSSYEDLVMWGVECFKEVMGLDSEALTALWNWEACKMNFLVPEYEMEEEAMDADYGYWLECSQDAMWITNNC